MAVCPNGQAVALANADGAINVCEVKSGKGLSVLKHPGPVLSLAFTDDGMTLASGGKGRDIRLWDLRDSRELLAIEARLPNIKSLAFSKGGDALLAWSSNLHNAWEAWDVATGRLLGQFRKEGGLLSTNELHCVSFSQDGRYVALGGGDIRAGWCHIWDWRGGQLSHLPDNWVPIKGSGEFTGRIHDNWTGAVGFAPDGRALATGSALGEIKLWSVTRAAARRLPSSNPEAEGHMPLCSRSLPTVPYWLPHAPRS